MNSDIRTDGLLALARELECRVVYDEPLAKYTTFKTGGPCYAMVDPGSEDRLARLIGEANASGVRHLVMGKGSNILFDDKGYNGVIFLMGQSVDEIRMLDENTIYAQAGCPLIKLCRFALEHNLTGLEFAYGIPGTVGGAIYMNAGAYGGEIKDVIKSCTAIRPSGEIHVTELVDMGLGYRKSCFQHNKEIVFSGIFSLETGIYDDIQDTMVELMGRRRAKQPLEYPSAGSTFKRPEGHYAGQLIEECGLAGFGIGGAEVSEKHCGFIINKNNATSADILALIKEVQKIVQEKTGVLLEPEVRLIPYEE